MDNRPGFQFTQSIRTRVLVFILAISLIGALALGYVGINALLDARATAQQMGNEILTTQVQDFLNNLTAGIARQSELYINDIGSDALNLATFAANIFDHKDIFLETSLWNYREHMRFGPSGQYYNREDDISSVFVPNFAKHNQELYDTLELTAHLDYLLKAVFDNNPNIVAAYVGTENEITRYYPNIHLETLLPPDFQVTQRPWYLAAKNSGAKGITWSPVYEDSTGKGYLVTASAPIYDSTGKLVGVIGLDISLSNFNAMLRENQIPGASYSILIDREGVALVFPQQANLDFFGSIKGQDLTLNLLETDTALSPIAQEMIQGKNGFAKIPGFHRELFVSYAPIENTGWSVATIASAEDTLRAVSVLEEEITRSSQELLLYRMLPIGLGVFILAIVLSIWAANRLVNPIRELASAAERIGEGEWDTPLPLPTRDEIGLLTQTFRKMASQLRDMVRTLEDRVQERTKLLEQRTRQIQTAAELGQAITTYRNLDTLFTQVTELISERFGFYHVGIFLVDNKNEYAVLRAANSPGGRRMLARGHRLRIGQEGIVGFVTGYREPRIALDVGKDAVFFDNPDLPETRSEMALPLIVGDRLIGAIDVQSTEPEAFSDDDIETLQILANLVAVAIDNAMLFEQSEEALQSTRKAYQELTRSAWERVLKDYPALGFVARSDDITIHQAGGKWDSLIEQAIATGKIQVDEETNNLALPIVIRGQTTGALRLKKDKAKGEWTEDEISLLKAISISLSDALESARLYSETKRRAERERLVTEITTKIRSTTDPQQMIQIAVQELQSVLNRKQANPSRDGDNQENTASKSDLEFNDNGDGQS